jgi:mannose/fructose-specific phosphotransferase system component IIA
VLRRLRERADVRIVTGVNLAMLLDFVFHRNLSVDAAAARAVDVGEKAIKVSA